ncbi:Cwf21-domain-containing protein [Coleophoma crateriformis]|uniref:Cwf21-domain-containing protein n=1 Tax=Coleophoma crateriformis TaxID=565419 RepID=A0A3D8T6W5_9HELO|nr:Cwf21-domain-containing protein [Coleophoma crateriformis]
MSSNVGLTTPRGSGTSGYVQRNLAHLKPRDQAAPYSKDLDSLKHRQRQPDKEILEHDRKREVEVKVFELRDRLEDEGVDEEEIEEQTDALRHKLLKEMAKGNGKAGNGRGLKMHQVHELAEAKIKQDDRFRSALGISKNYEEGGHWKKQEERLSNSLKEESSGLK